VTGGSGSPRPVPAGAGPDGDRPVRSDEHGPPRRAGRWHGRDSSEFGRVVNLSDAVFAIALTLLVLNLEAPRVPAGELAGALADQSSEFVAFALAFFLVANVWWQHHRIFAVFGSIEPGMMAINMVVLAGVALVPFPTSLVGASPDDRAAVLCFIGLFASLTLLWLCLILRADVVGAWRRHLPRPLLRWLLGDWLANGAVMAVALVVTLWSPIGGLVVLAGGSLVTGATMGRLGPAERKDWF
jgi:uncharacterized membrane protein